ncbi:adenosylcobinamide-GDP ribazoletransferase [Jatrophihabitans fulvus]
MITALGMFSIVPVPARTWADGDGRRALRWLPVVGLALGAVAGLPLTAVAAATPHATLLGAVLAVAALALLTRGLHLDGLADTADGLGSRAPAARALEIMRQSDIGPFGVVTLVLVLLADVASLATLDGVWTGCAALAVAAATGRVAALQATSAPPARPDGFGALVRGAAAPPLQAVAAGAVLVVGGLLAVAVDAGWWRWPLAQLVALVVAFALRWHTTRRFGGTTGDVYGAVIETATAVTLAGMCLR